MNPRIQSCHGNYIVYIITSLHGSRKSGWMTSITTSRVYKLLTFSFVDLYSDQYYSVFYLFNQGGSRDHTLCMMLACWDATSGDCKTSVSVRAYDGTTCGNRMWCMMGQCVSSSAAPSTNTGASHQGLVRVHITRGDLGVRPSGAMSMQPLLKKCQNGTGAIKSYIIIVL